MKNLFILTLLFSINMFSQQEELIGKWIYSEQKTIASLKEFQKNNDLQNEELDEISNNFKKIQPYIILNSNSNCEMLIIQNLKKGTFSIKESSIIMIIGKAKKQVLLKIQKNKTELKLQPEGIFPIYFKKE
ncbi:MAG: hypothetical protein HRT69_16250 [Flavobacteriaceae bacterium]|nr:hypothetical protein [Flavobacteriaceae bacterium]